MEFEKLNIDKEQKKVCCVLINIYQFQGQYQL